MDTITEVHQIIQKVLLKKNDSNPFADNDLLLTSGRLQSIDTLDLILELENKYGLDFSDHPFDRDDFDSVTNISHVVEKCSMEK
jgi:acyl carrier protein